MFSCGKAWQTNLINILSSKLVETRSKPYFGGTVLNFALERISIKVLIDIAKLSYLHNLEQFVLKNQDLIQLAKKPKHKKRVA